MPEKIDFSIVVPVYNEEDNVDELYRGIVDALCGFDKSYEGYQNASHSQ